VQTPEGRGSCSGRRRVPQPEVLNGSLQSFYWNAEILSLNTAGRALLLIR
jgi:hypothetical protein